MTATAKPDFAVTFPASLPALSIADTEIRGTAEAMGAVLDFRSRALPALEQIVTNKGTNGLGKIEAWTTMAEAELPKLHSARAKVEEDRKALATKLAEVEATAQVVPPTTAAEVQNMWAIEAWWRSQTPAQHRELTDRMNRGELTDLRDSLLALPTWACPLVPPVRAMLLADRTEAHVDQVVLARLKAQAEDVNTVSRILSEHIGATEGGSDRERLRSKGFDIPKARSEMTDKEMSDVIDQKGLTAFQKLPA